MLTRKLRTEKGRGTYSNSGISKTSTHTWQARFQVISIDDLHEQSRRDDVFTIHRDDPTFSNKTAEQGRDVSTPEPNTGSNSQGMPWPASVAAALAITVLAALGAIGVRRWRSSSKQ